MPESSSLPSVRAHFAGFDFDAASGELRQNGIKVKVEGQPLHVLAMLLERPGELVTREEIQQRLWPDETFVDFERGINTAVTRLRQGLHDSADTPRFIETLPRRGYRFIYPLANGHPAGAEIVRPHQSRRRALVRVAILCVAVVIVAASFSRLRTTLFPPHEIRSLAVLPFANLTGDPRQEYVADGVADALTTELAQLKRLEVTSATSAMQIKGQAMDLRDIGKKFQVDAVIEGSVQKTTDHRWIVNVQLVDTRSDRHRWARRYERSTADVATMQGELAQDVVREIHLQLSPQEQARLSRSQIASPEAYELYLKGRQVWWKRITEEGHLKSIEHYERAIAFDPAYAPAYAAMARSYAFLWQLEPSDHNLVKIAAATNKALVLDPGLGEAHSMLAWLKAKEGDWAGAEQEHRRALELSPNDALSRVSYAFFLNQSGKHEEALKQIRHAERVDPLSAFVSAGVILRLNFLGRHDEAVVQARKALEIDPHFWLTYQFLGDTYREKGQTVEAIAAWEKALAQPGAYPHWPLSRLVEAYVAVGRTSDAKKALSGLETLAKERWVEPARMALAYAALGKKQEAFRWLELGLKEDRPGGRIWNEIARYLGNEPRFQELRRRRDAVRPVGPPHSKPSSTITRLQNP